MDRLKAGKDGSKAKKRKDLQSSMDRLKGSSFKATLSLLSIFTIQYG